MNNSLGIHRGSRLCPEEKIRMLRQSTYWIFGVRNSKSGHTKGRHHIYMVISFTYHGVLLESRCFSLVWSTVVVS